MIDTNETLLDRLKVETAHEAWEEFYRGYSTAVMRYAMRLGLDHARAEDVLQETMVVLMRLLPTFAYDRRRGRFRNFLLTITHRQALGILRRAKRRGEVPLQQTTECAAPEAPAPELWEDALLAQAVENMRRDPAMEPRTFAVFEAYVLQRRPVTEVAAEFGLTGNAVYLVKNRLLRQLRAEVARLRRDSETEES